MDLAEIRRLIDAKVAENIIPAVLAKASAAHKRDWRECNCRWCLLKQRATEVIAGVRCGDRSLRADIRWHRANEFRELLKQEENEL